MDANQLNILNEIVKELMFPSTYDWWMFWASIANVVAFIILTIFIICLNYKFAKNQEKIQIHGLKIQLYDKRVAVYYDLVDTYLRLAPKNNNVSIEMEKVDDILFVCNDLISVRYIVYINDKNKMLFRHNLIAKSIFAENICDDLQKASVLFNKINNNVSEMQREYCKIKEEPSLIINYILEQHSKDEILNKYSELAGYLGDNFMKLLDAVIIDRKNYLELVHDKLRPKIMKLIDINTLDM
ncbi:MAG: hypothetical protein H6Q15_1065 [Bacteroidetes bacterium]|nr:hypothetical protein [Bacteroidota bacterium]